jgi:hypothetical protein
MKGVELQILDSQGKELRVGSRVEAPDFFERPAQGEVVGFDRLCARVRFAGQPLPWAFAVDLMWRIPALTLTDTEED